MIAEASAVPAVPAILSYTNKKMNDPGPPPGRSHSSGQDILLPLGPSKRKHHTMLLEINSRDRNLVAYPSSSNFRVAFQRPLKDVCSIQIVGGTIPTKIFNIDQAWNKFTFQESATSYTVTLTPGRYTTTQLASQLATQLNSLGGSNTYTCSVLPTTDQLVITRATGTASFTLLFASGIYQDLFNQQFALETIRSPRKLLGFGYDDYISNSSGTITSPMAMDVDFLLNRVYVFVNHNSQQDLGMIERSIGKWNPHAIVYMDEPSLTYKTLTKDLFQPTYTATPTPIARIATLDISLRDEFHNILNLNGRDFTLLLEISYLN